MNGCLFFITLVYMLRWQLGEKARPLLSQDFWNKLQKCLKTRDYRLSALVPQGIMEERLKTRLCEEVRKGTLKLEALEKIGACYATSHRQQNELQVLLNSYMIHLGFVLFVPFAIRLLLSGKLYFSRVDLPALSIVLLGFLLMAVLLGKVWPQAALAREPVLWDFVLAYLGDRDCGSWKPEMEELSRESFVSGIDSAAERKERLASWQELETLKFDQRRAFLENCLGPAELVMTCFFSGVLLAMPLLSHFRTLVP